MAGKKRTMKLIIKEPTPVPTSIVPVVPPKRELILEGDPDAQLAFATKAANALMNLVNQKKNPVTIGGKTYLEYGDWQVLARFYGATVEVEWTEKIVDEKGVMQGYEARVLVKRNGEVISSAEGMCMRDEKRWRNAEDYAIRSMAQTRTAAKALRNAFGWVAELAGYSATPAEEMPQSGRGSENPTMPPFSVTPSVVTKKQTIMAQLKTLGLELVSKKEYEDAVLEQTKLELKEENYDGIIEALNDKIAVDPDVKFEKIINEKDN